MFGPNDFRALVRPIKEVHEKAFSALIIDSAADTEIYDAFYRDRQHLVGGMDVARPRMFSERRQRHDVGNAYWMSAALALLGVVAQIQLVAIGLIIIIAVTSDRLAAKKS